MKSIDINEIKQLGEINLIDVREVDEFKEQSVKGAINIPMMGLLNNANMFLDKGETYYIMCRSGKRSYTVCSFLEENGYDVVNLEGGILGYVE